VQRRTPLVLAAAAVFVVAGCSPIPEGAVEAEAFECPVGTEGCEDVLPIGPGGTVEMDMGDFFFTVTGGQPITGEVEVTVDNVSGQYHNAVFLGAADGSGLPEAEGGEEGTDTVLLFPGEWTVICDVPGHRQAGMETTVTVYATEEEYEAAVELGETDVDRDADAAPQG
jgi:plastocyanin